ncbi:MFS transporter [Caulobacter segnis]|uniref:MFS transporter n=1 Tax=Caulobacter segnis TaxID=88688 RepID=UPI00241049F4|nr:MFS transporter [Caulobacter segnis]MDG2520465.1 MFS transporter [Caulobacter segnis]
MSRRAPERAASPDRREKAGTPGRASSSADGQVLALCFAAAVIEGFDLQAAGVVAAGLSDTFGLTPGELAWVFSGNTLGLLFGAAIGGWASDRVGRKWVLVASLMTFGLFSLVTAAAPSKEWLLAARVLTGLGLGGAFPMLLSLAAEAGSAERRVSRTTFISVGMPVGGVLASLLVLSLPDLDWERVFHVGGLAPIALAVVMVLWLHPAPLITGQAQAAPPPSLPVTLFAADRRLITVSLWAAFFATLALLYLLLNWLPLLMQQRGVARSLAVGSALAFSGGGILGALMLGAMIDAARRGLVVTVTYVGMGLALAAVILGIGHPVAAAAAAGFFIIGAQFVLYGLAAGAYPALMRGSGVGAAVAVGRLGAVAGPLLAGAVVARGADPSAFAALLLPLAAVGGLAAMMLVSVGTGRQTLRV